MKQFSLRIYLLLFIGFLGLSARGQEITALQVVQEQLDAYNAGEIDRFMSVFADSISFVDFKTGRLSLEGKDQVRQRFDDYFAASPNFQSNLAGRIHFDNVVIDHEKITGSRGSEEMFEIVMIYEVNEDGKIFRASSVRKN